MSKYAGIPECDRPDCRLVGEDGNVFDLISIVSRTLWRAGYKKESNELFPRINEETEDYDHALRIMMEYVNIY